MKKRQEFVSVRYEYSTNDEVNRLRFIGESVDQVLDLIRTSSGIRVEASHMPGHFDLKNAGLVGRVGWIYLGFAEDAELHRIGVFVGTLDHTDLDRDLRRLLSGLPITYSHLQPREDVVVTCDGLADDGSIFQAIVWVPGSDSNGIRVTLEADDPLEAYAEVKRRFGTDSICTIHNERAATRPRI